MNKIIKSKILRISLKIGLYIFGIIGFLLTSAFFAVKLHLTNDPGTVDKNDRYFMEIANKDYTTSIKNFSGIDSLYNKNEANTLLFYKISILNNYFPQNAHLLIKAYENCKNIAIVEKMLDAVCVQLKDNIEFNTKINQAEELFKNKKKIYMNQNAIPWLNMEEWIIFRQACLKDKQLIDSAAKVTGVEARLITAMLVGEQIRLFNSQREAFKAAIAPLKILAVETKFSLGVTGIKEETAIKVEKFLKDKDSPFYLGYEFENIINYNTSDKTSERYNRLINYNNHYYSYLYTALILKQIKVQWERAGFDISERPEILATLYNLGYEVSVPKENPQTGGSRIWLNSVMYTFGVISFDFYFSGELIEEFPIQQKKWS